MWNQLAYLHQIDIQQANRLLKAFKMVDKELVIFDAPIEQLRRIIGAKVQQVNGKKLALIIPKKKWKRFILYDPYLSKRFKFIEDHVLNGSRVKRYLILCPAARRDHWLYRGFTNGRIRVGCYSEQFMEQVCIHIMVYEQFERRSESLRDRINQYNGIVVDEREYVYESREIGGVLDYILREKYDKDRQIILILSKIRLDLIGIEQLSLLRFSEQYNELLYLHQNCYISDLSWMKRRYKQNRLKRELYYIFNCSIWIHVDEFQNKNINRNITKMVVIQNILVLKQQTIHKFKALDKQYRMFNCKQILIQFNNNSIKQSFCNNDQISAKFNYVSQVRQLILMEKLPHFLQIIYNWTNKLKLKFIIVIHNKNIQSKIQKYLLYNQISFCIYQVYQSEDLYVNQYQIYAKMGKNSICIVNIDYINKTYRKYLTQRDLLHIDQDSLNCTLHPLQVQPMLDSKHSMLKKITHVRHILHYDTFWYKFDKDKEDVLRSIYGFPLPYGHYQKLASHETNWIDSPFEIINHHFICKDSYELMLFETYQKHHQAYEKKVAEQTCTMNSNSIERKKILQQFTQDILKQTAQKYKENQRIDFVDIDEQYDKLQFQEQQQLKRENESQKKEYAIKERSNVFGHKRRLLKAKIKNIHQIEIQTDYINNNTYQELKKQIKGQVSLEGRQIENINIDKYLIEKEEILGTKVKIKQNEDSQQNEIEELSTHEQNRHAFSFNQKVEVGDKIQIKEECKNSNRYAQQENSNRYAQQEKGKFKGTLNFGVGLSKKNKKQQKQKSKRKSTKLQGNKKIGVAYRVKQQSTQSKSPEDLLSKEKKLKVKLVSFQSKLV